MMFTCGICFKQYVTSKSLITHLKIIHNCKDNSIFKCAAYKCFRSFNSLNSFRKHLNTHKAISDKTFELPISKCNSMPEINFTENTSIFSTHHDKNNPKKVDNEETTYVDRDIMLSHHRNQHFKDILDAKIISFVAKMYANTTFSRKDVRTVIDDVNNVLKEPLYILKNNVAQTLRAAHTPIEQTENIYYQFTQLENMFSGLQSDYLCLKFLEKIDCYIPPVSYIVGNRLDNTKDGIPSCRNYMSQFIPIDKVLQKFFELPFVLEETVNHIQDLKTKTSLSNIIQTQTLEK